MVRKNTRTGLYAAIGLASAYSYQYYFATDTGLYYYSDGVSWSIQTFNEGRSVANRSGTIATQNVAQVIAGANTDRKWFFFQNLSNADMYLGLGYVPTTANGILVPKDGASMRLEAFVVTDAIYVLCDSASKAFVALEG